MATMATTSRLLCGFIVLLTCSLESHVQANQKDAKKNHGKFKPEPWKDASATFYGSPDGGDTTAGSCGYTNTVNQGFGLETAAVSNALYNEGKICGACIEIKCERSPERCKPGKSAITVAATNNCPPNYALPSDDGGWCNPPRVHFDLSQPAFVKIAESKAGIVPVKYRRVPCKKQGGIRFSIDGHKYYTKVLVWNVAGAGDVQAVSVKGKKGGWIPMKRDWGQCWVASEDLTGQNLSFRVMTSDKRESTGWHIVPENWQYGQTFEGKNFS